MFLCGAHSLPESIGAVIPWTTAGKRMMVSSVRSSEAAAKEFKGIETLCYINEFRELCAADTADFGRTLHVVSHPETVDERLWHVLRATGVTNLMLAMSLNNIDVAKVFMAVGQLNERTREGVTALMLASVFGCTEAVQVLVRKGADVDPKTDNGETAVTLARRCGRADIVRLLNEAGAGGVQDKAFSRVHAR